ncbi:hypothetical protein GGR43_000801 [Sphingobium jiangsuense]|uniref:Uncharacterized protein n=1 Tax=Sphingobium jiangsuense TaxID=870476 RepID=A0A7W6BDW0_9SPHN|nr:hypothetical protein [Sphingobium jiangsuense]
MVTMPSICAAAMVIGWRAAELIRQDWQGR